MSKKQAKKDFSGPADCKNVRGVKMALKWRGVDYDKYSNAIQNDMQFPVHLVIDNDKVLFWNVNESWHKEGHQLERNKKEVKTG